MKELIAFLKSKLFLKNLAVAIVIIVLFFWGAVKFLDVYTRHGQFTKLPDFSKKALTDVEKTLKGQNLNYIIIDSSYNATLPPHTVINQIPYPGAHVKKHRNVYLYITTATAPLVEMPNVVDVPMANAQLMLQSSGLKVGKISRKNDICVGCVLKATYKGKDIQAGDKIPQGSTINLIVGKNALDSL